jgi:hypothetical protein
MFNRVMYRALRVPPGMGHGYSLSALNTLPRGMRISVTVSDLRADTSDGHFLGNR